MREYSYDVKGTKIYAMPNGHLKSFCLALYVKAGCLYEAPEENGYSHLFEHIVFRNLKNKYGDFYGIMARHGLDLSGTTYKEFIRFAIIGPAGEFGLASDILCSLFDEINIPSSELEKEKKRIKAERREGDMSSSLECFFNRLVWKDTELEKWRYERCAELDRISRKKINGFRRKIFTENNFFIYATGNVTDKDIDLLKDKLGNFDFPAGERKKENTVSVNGEFFHRDFSVNVKDSYWHYVGIGFDVDRSKYRGGVLDLLYAVLFKTEKALFYSYMSEDNPLVYSYDSTLELYDNVGNIGFSYEVDGKKAEESIALAVKMLQDVKEGTFDYEAYLRAELYDAMLEVDKADSLNWSMAYYNHILDTDPLDYSDSFYGRFNVTKEQVVAAAKDIFCGSNITVAVKGDKRKVNVKRIKEILYALGE